MSESLLRKVAFAPYALFLRKIVNTLFHIDWYYHMPKMGFLGVGTIQNPMDMWVKQEILFDVKPDVVIECGTHRGGTALYYATLMAAFNPEGRIITIDIENKVQKAGEYEVFRKYCQRIMGDSTSAAVVSQVAAQTRGKKVLVILDSLHTKDHVLKEMELYGRLVSPGSYLIVEDTDINGHPVMPNYGPGPHEAVVEYQKNHPGEFVIDKSREKMGFTCFPDGFLKRVK